MIVVKLEMWPGGNENHPRKYELGRAYIHNVSGTSESAELGDYKVRVCRRGSSDFNGPITREGSVKDYPRLKFNVWRLIIRALRSSFPEEK